MLYNLAMSDSLRSYRRRLSQAKIREIRPPVKVGFDGKVIPPHTNAPVKYWRVNVGKRISGKSKERLMFRTEREAKEWIRLNSSLRHPHPRVPFTLAVARLTI